MAGAGLGGLAKGRRERAGNFFFILGQMVFRAAGDGVLDNADALIDCAMKDAHVCFNSFSGCRWLVRWLVALFELWLLLCVFECVYIQRLKSSCALYIRRGEERAIYRERRCRVEQQQTTTSEETNNATPRDNKT